MLKKKLLFALGLVGSLAALNSPATAATVLTFEGLQNLEPANNYYNGGTGGFGSSGTNYGISFSSNSIALIDSDAGGGGNTANEPSPETTLAFLSGAAATMNVAAGFNTGFSFYYAATFYSGSVNVYSGLDGTGDLLASLLLSPTGTACAGDPNGYYCAWSPIGVDFAGTAHSVDFGGSANYIVFDNITLGSATPESGAVPEPATWAMMLLGFGALGHGMRRRTSAKALQIA